MRACREKLVPRLQPSKIRHILCSDMCTITYSLNPPQSPHMQTALTVCRSDWTKALKYILELWLFLPPEYVRQVDQVVLYTVVVFFYAMNQPSDFEWPCCPAWCGWWSPLCCKWASQLYPSPWKARGLHQSRAETNIRTCLPHCCQVLPELCVHFTALAPITSSGGPPRRALLTRQAAYLCILVHAPSLEPWHYAMRSCLALTPPCPL